MSEDGMRNDLSGNWKDFDAGKSTDDIAVWEAHIAATKHLHVGVSTCSGRCGAKNIPYEHEGTLDKIGQVDPPAWCPDCRKKMGMAPLPKHLAEKLEVLAV